MRKQQVAAASLTIAGLVAVALLVIWIVPWLGGRPQEAERYVATPAHYVEEEARPELRGWRAARLSKPPSNRGLYPSRYDITPEEPGPSFVPRRWQTARSTGSPSLDGEYDRLARAPPAQLSTPDHDVLTE